MLSRREFLKVAAMGLGGLALSAGTSRPGFANRRSLYQEKPFTPPFPEDVPLGRICLGEPGTRFDIKSEPFWNAPSIGTAWFDDVFSWKREVIANPEYLYHGENQRWVEVDEGYIYSENIQEVRYLPQEPLSEIPEMPNGEKGMWVEIVSPYLNLILNKSKNSYQYWIAETLRPRLYYSQVFWAFDVRKDPETEQTQYCLKQRFGAFDSDTYWVDASGCRQITPEEISPINPGNGNKHAVVNLSYQTLTCFEGNKEVYFTKVSTGAKTASGNWITPAVTQPVWRKSVSIHMSEGNAAIGNYDIPGIGWSTFINNNGIAVHSTFWHNSFGTARSHGCVNAKPEDAKWFWRWSEPNVSYYEGDWMSSEYRKSTLVEVVED